MTCEGHKAANTLTFWLFSTTYSGSSLATLEQCYFSHDHFACFSNNVPFFPGVLLLHYSLVDGMLGSSASPRGPWG